MSSTANTSRRRLSVFGGALGSVVVAVGLRNFVRLEL